MKRFVLVVVLTGLVSVTALAGNIPTNDSPSPQPPPTTSQSATSTALANVVLTIITLIGR